MIGCPFFNGLFHSVASQAPECFVGNTLLTAIGQHSVTLRTSLGSQASAAVGFRWLLVVLAASHFFFDATSFDQFAKSSDCLLNRFLLAYQQLYHFVSKCNVLCIVYLSMVEKRDRICERLPWARILTSCLRAIARPILNLSR